MLISLHQIPLIRSLSAKQAQTAPTGSGHGLCVTSSISLSPLYSFILSPPTSIPYTSSPFTALLHGGSSRRGHYIRRPDSGGKKKERGKGIPFELRSTCGVLMYKKAPFSRKSFSSFPDSVGPKWVGARCARHCSSALRQGELRLERWFILALIDLDLETLILRSLTIHDAH